MRSPRRRSASSRWAFSMAASPPLTATYMSALRRRDAGGARQAGDAVWSRRRSGRRRAENARLFWPHCSAKWRGSADAARAWRGSRCPGLRSTSGRRRIQRSRPGGSAWSSGQDSPACPCAKFSSAIRSAGSCDEREMRLDRVGRRSARRCGRRSSPAPRPTRQSADRARPAYPGRTASARTAAPAGGQRRRRQGRAVRARPRVPGRAIASMMARKVDCASKTGSRKAPSMTDAFAISLLRARG